MTRERSAVERPCESRRYLAWLPIVAAVTGAIVSSLLAAVVVIPGFHQGTDLSSAGLPARLGLAVIVLTPGVIGVVLELLTARLFVDADGIVFWRYFRRVRLRWVDIRSFEVVRARSMGPWSEVLVRAISGEVHRDDWDSWSRFEVGEGTTHRSREGGREHSGGRGLPVKRWCGLTALVSVVVSFAGVVARPSPSARRVLVLVQMVPNVGGRRSAALESV